MVGEHEVSTPVGSSPAGCVLPAGHVVHTLDSVSEQDVATSYNSLRHALDIWPYTRFLCQQSSK